MFLLFQSRGRFLSYALDFVASDARKYKIRLILTLTNNWEAYGGKAQYVKWGNASGLNLTSDDDFFTDPTIKGYYKSHVKAMGVRIHRLVWSADSVSARRLRKTLGGGIRQVGVLTASAYVALRDNVNKLEDDDRKDKILADRLNQIKQLSIDTASVESNMGIHAINLGDSSFIIVREGCTILRSPVQQHDFNFTYQLESGNGCDLPSAAQAFAVPVAAGDVIIVGTDGLFNNLYNNEVIAVVVHAVRAGFGPHVTAQKIAALARQRALDKERQTPFSTAA